MKNSVDVAIPATYQKEHIESPPRTQGLSFRLREKRSRVSAVFTIILGVVLLNSWWFLSRFVDSQSFDFLKLSAINSHGTDDEPVTGLSQMNDVCDFSRGKWVPVEKPPLYTNDTCKYIHRSQDCMKNGRPDRGYLNWRWQPLSCELPHFDAQLFLQSLKQKKMAFIGDSIARNHMHSLLCALSQVEDPRNAYFDVKEKDATWEFVSYNFTLSNIWSPFLVNHTFENNIYHIHLDIPDVVWSSQLPSYDIAILSTGYWYFRPSIYYMNNTILGTNPHSGINLTIFDKLPAMRQAWETVLNYMVDNFNGITIMRTITVPHFESGSWSTGGSCNKTQPLFDPYMNESLPWMSDAMSKVQNQEFKRAVEHIHSHAIDPKRLRLLNITYNSFLRPDGHPNSFRIMTPHEPRSDCLHWCLPGPIDTWNEILMQIILG